MSVKPVGRGGRRGVPPRPSVSRDVLYRSDVVTIRDNACGREDPALGPPTAPMPYHEVCFVHRGLWVRHVRGQELTVDPSSIHFFNRGEVHRVSHPLGCGDRNVGFEFADAALRDLASGTDDGPFAHRTRPADVRVWALHRLVMGWARESERPSVAVDEAVLLLLHRTLEGPAARPSPAADSATARRRAGLARDALSLVAQDYASPLTLSGMADALGCSPFHLARVFRACTGRTLHETLRSTRLAAALDRITEGDEGLADVAAATGFADRSHLSRCFRAAFGLPPSEFRRASRPALARRLADRSGGGAGPGPSTNRHASRRRVH